MNTVCAKIGKKVPLIPTNQSVTATIIVNDFLRSVSCAKRQIPCCQKVATCCQRALNSRKESNQHSGKKRLNELNKKQAMLQILLPLQALLGPGGGMVDTPDLKSCDFRVVRVQVPPGVQLRVIKPM